MFQQPSKLHPVSQLLLTGLTNSLKPLSPTQHLPFFSRLLPTQMQAILTQASQALDSQSLQNQTLNHHLQKFEDKHISLQQQYKQVLLQFG
jgi:hypothetical protein